MGAQTTAGFMVYLFLNFGFGIFGQWAQAGCNWPILSQIVPEAYRSRVMAIEGAMENSAAAFLGPYFLAYTGEWLGFRASDAQPGNIDVELATRMGLSLCLTTCGPWLLAFIVYSFLHVTVPLDLLAAREEAAAAEKENPSQRRDSSADIARGMSKTFSA